MNFKLLFYISQKSEVEPRDAPGLLKDICVLNEKLNLEESFLFQRAR